MRRLHHILYLPLTLKWFDGKGRADRHVEVGEVESWFKRHGAGRWARVDPLERLNNTQPATAYAEFVYFHPFIQRILYGDPGGGGRPSGGPNSPLVLAREDIDSVRIVLAGDPSDRQFDLKVERVHLYVFDLSIAILVSEVSWEFGSSTPEAPKAMPWNDLLDLHDSLRRVYPPAWERREHPKKSKSYRDHPVHTPRRVRWLRQGQEQPPDGDPYNDATNPTPFIDWAKRSSRPPILGHWRWLLEPLVPEGDPSKAEGVRYSLLGDERMGSLTYVSVDNPLALSRGDFVRLALADDSGSSHTLPYSGVLLRDFEAEHCYERFWDPDTNGHEWMRTRYFSAGYATAIVTKEPEDGAARFTTDPVSGLLAHARHHYLQLGLVAHLHHAAWLMYSDRLSEVVGRMPGRARSDRDDATGADDDQRWRSDLLSVEQSLLRFLDRYWFLQVTNHVQGRELFDLWSRHLGTRTLADHVVEEAGFATRVARAEEQEAAAERGNRIQILVMILAGAAISASLAGAFGSLSIWIAVAFAVISVGLVIFGIITARSKPLQIWLMQTLFRQRST